MKSVVWVGDKRKKEKKKLEFSQRLCHESWALMSFTVMICMAGEFLLQWTQRGSMREVVTIVLSLISFVTVFINGGYITQNIFRDTSLNKHGLRVPKDGSGKHYLQNPNLQQDTD